MAHGVTVRPIGRIDAGSCHPRKTFKSGARGRPAGYWRFAAVFIFDTVPCFVLMGRGTIERGWSRLCARRRIRKWNNVRGSLRSP